MEWFRLLPSHQLPFPSTSSHPIMKSSPPPPLSSLYANMESEVLQRRIRSFWPWLLALSVLFLLFTLHSSSPFILTSKDSLIETPPSSSNHSDIEPEEAVNQSPLLSQPNNTILPPNKSLNQSPSISDSNKSSTPKSPNPLNDTSKDGFGQNPPTSELNTSPSPLVPRIDGSQEECDLFEGKWVKDPRGPVYTNSTCPTLPDLRNCKKYGKDQGHLQWRWKPDGCELPRFEPGDFLSMARGKKLAFIGDSLARNHMESMLCALSQAETPLDIYKDDEDKHRTWYFPSHNFTLMVIWSEFLVARTPRNVSNIIAGFDVHLDKIDTYWADKLPDLNYLVINNGNWFFRKNFIYEGGKLIGCVSCAGEPNLTHFEVDFVVKRVVKTALQFISRCEKCEGLVTLLRTFSMSHFEHGAWNSGGYCNRTQPLNASDLSLEGDRWGLRNIQLEEMGMVKERYKGEKVRFEVMDVTKAMMMRVDGHPGPHWTWGKSAKDCLHWCLPGPIDMWNELLFAILKKGSAL